MPELPEVEIQVRQLARRLRGAKIVALQTPDPKLRLPRSIVGRRICRVRRRAKFIVFDLDDGRHLVAHLRMTGWFEFRPSPRYRAALVTDRATAYFEDGRRLGVLMVVTGRELDAKLTTLGPEPLRDGADWSRLWDTGRPIKTALLDQHRIAGMGNIYASESLWRAGIHPQRRANRLNLAERDRLRRAVVATLREAIAHGPRIFQTQRLAVYDRAGQPCRRCGATVRRVVQNQRSTFFCPQCQC